jgi:5'-phosphate synthase pdxT subunit
VSEVVYRVPSPGDLERRLEVGVLALQGDYALHEDVFRRTGAAVRRVRTPAELEGIDALTIPGGESTTLLHLIEATGLRAPLAGFVAAKPVLGTCAGLILLADELNGGDAVPFPPLGALDVLVERNAYGRQIDSFTSPIRLDAIGGQEFEGVFIRAPRIRRVGDGVEVVASLDGEPVGVRRGTVMGLTFHPELTADLRLHRYFLAACCGQPID